MPSTRPSLRLSGVGFAYGDDVPIFSDLDLHLSPGWTGVVGPNGAGKTTLLRLLGGALAPRSGQLHRDPRDLLAHLCPQRVDALDADLQAFAWTWDKAAVRWRARLGLDVADIERWPTLSPGERKRWQIAAAVSRAPDLLMLDEPTNHIDGEARDALSDALADFQGIGLVVSHDRAFMDRLCGATLRVTHGRATLYAGGYSAAQEAWTHQAAERQARYESARQAERDARRQLVAERRQRAAATRQLSARARMKNPGDNDARGVAAKERVRKAEAKRSQHVAVARGALDRAAEARREAAEVRMDDPLGGDLFLSWEPSPKRRVFELVAPALRAGDRTLLEQVQLVVERDERVCLAGPNGSGKTTLLARLVEDAARALPPERLLYLPQHLPPRRAAELLAELRALPRDLKGEILTVVAALGVDPARLLATERPSPGEARKLAIAWGLGRRVWALVLDEPTNHLDLPSIERLEAALRQYPGALLLVSHDARFAERVCDRHLRIVDRRLEDISSLAPAPAPASLGGLSGVEDGPAVRHVETE